MIVDEFTGRIMPGRRWSDGLHQAIEAKEGVKIERENQTLATITFQNYFRMYKKLAGMTGTAETEAAEFYKIYKLEVTAIPTNRPMIRKEFQDIVYRTEEEKFRNAAKFIKELNDKGPAGAGRHDFGRKVGEALRHSEQDGRAARGSEREESRARSVDRGAGRTQRRGYGLDQHGRPRYRHSARRQCGVPARGTRRGRPDLDPEAMPNEQWQAMLAEMKVADRSRSTTKWSSSAGCASSAPSATNPAVSIISFADAPAARAIRAASRFYPVPAGRSAAHFRRRADSESDAAARHGRGRADRVEADHASVLRRRRRRLKRRTSPPVSTCSNTTT